MGYIKMKYYYKELIYIFDLGLLIGGNVEIFRVIYLFIYLGNKKMEIKKCGVWVLRRYVNLSLFVCLRIFGVLYMDFFF